MVVSYETPIGFHHYASDFALWADRSRQHKTKFYSPVPYYLYCRALELGLKAFLLARGVTKKRLKTKTLGHNLEALALEAERLGLNDVMLLPDAWVVELRRANTFYHRKEFEYFDIGNALRLHELPSLEILHSLCTALLGAIRPLCIEAADMPSVPR